MSIPRELLLVFGRDFEAAVVVALKMTIKMRTVATVPAGVVQRRFVLHSSGTVQFRVVTLPIQERLRFVSYGAARCCPRSTTKLQQTRWRSRKAAVLRAMATTSVVDDSVWDHPSLSAIF